MKQTAWTSDPEQLCPQPLYPGHGTVLLQH